MNDITTPTAEKSRKDELTALVRSIVNNRTVIPDTISTLFDMVADSLVSASRAARVSATVERLITDAPLALVNETAAHVLAYLADPRATAFQAVADMHFERFLKARLAMPYPSHVVEVETLSQLLDGGDEHKRRLFLR